MKFTLFFLLNFIFNFSSHAGRCEGDTRKFCHSLSGARGEVFKCLSEHESELTLDCAKELRDFKIRAEKKNPCYQDLAEYCSKVPNTYPNLSYCLFNHEAKLGEKCSKDFKAKKTKLLSSDVCAQDVIAHCYSSVEAPNGSIMRCLIRKKTKLSKKCSVKIESQITVLKKKNPCFDDTEKFCPTQLKMVDIQECLEKKITLLAPLCESAVQKETAKAKANPCYRDLLRNCKPNLSIKLQNECLDISSKDLSSACRDYRRTEVEKIKRLRVNCEIDRLKYCKHVPFKEGLVIKCLKENKARTTLDCKKLL